jgi:hypothetical protein
MFTGVKRGAKVTAMSIESELSELRAYIRFRVCNWIEREPGKHTAKHLAERLGFSEAHISNIRKGQVSVGMDFWFAWAKSVGLSLPQSIAEAHAWAKANPSQYRAMAVASKETQTLEERLRRVQSLPERLPIEQWSRPGRPRTDERTIEVLNRTAPKFSPRRDSVRIKKKTPSR